MAFVLWWETSFQDGHEDHAKVFGTVEECLATINKWEEKSWGDRTQYRIFQLGKEIPIVMERIEEPQPPKTQTKYKLGKKK